MMAEEQPHEIVWTLANAVIPSRCLHVVAELGVADEVGNDPVGVAELASRCGADRDALDRVLRLLAAHGIFERHPEGYAHTEASRLLRSDHPQSMRAFARMMGLPVFGATFNALEPRSAPVLLPSSSSRRPGCGRTCRTTRARPRCSAKR